MANITGATSFFPKAAENSTPMTLGASISAGATSVTITNLSTNYSAGDVVVFTIDPSSPTLKQVFTGTVAAGATTVTGVIWTEGTNQPHTLGAAITDYTTATHWDLMQKGISVSHNQNGTLVQSAILAALNISSTPPADWTALPITPTLTASNGQREHVLTYAGVDYTDRLQAGSKLRIPRTSTVPTQSGQFVAISSQYASKASPAGITFTGDFTTEAWVYLNSYGSTTGSMIINRRNSSYAGGWEFFLTPTGQVLSRYGSSGSVYTDVTSYQSIPLKRWVHVAATNTVATKSITIYIDGIAVPVSTGTSTATSLIQTTDQLCIGTVGGGTTSGWFIDGQIAHVRLWSAARTAQQIRDNANKSLVGNETGLVGAWSLNGDFTDKTANANTLIASGGAIATYADNPWKATEYAIVTNTSYTGGNTTATVFSGSNAIPNETLGATSYSSARAPYGFPVDRNRWIVTLFDTSQHGAASLSDNVYNNPHGMFMTLPTGKWAIHESIMHYGAKNAAGGQTLNFYLGTGTTSNQILDSRLTTYYNTPAGTDYMQNGSKMFYYITPSLYQLYLQIVSSSSASPSSNTLRGDFNPTIITAECAYL